MSDYDISGMAREESLEIINAYRDKLRNSVSTELEGDIAAFDMAIDALKTEPCEDAISRQAVLDYIDKMPSELTSDGRRMVRRRTLEEYISDTLPPVNPQAKVGHCKDCKYFEYDSMAKVDGIPLIVAHEICNKWGDGCKTKEDGYCFLFEPQEREGKE